MSDSKVFVLSTSVLVHDPNAIEQLGRNIIVVPLCVIQELNEIKDRQTLPGSSSRYASLILDRYSAGADIRNGVKTKSGGKLFLDCRKINWNSIKVDLEKNNSNKIIIVAKELQGEPVAKGKDVIILSKDTNLRVVARTCGILAQDYLHDKKISRIQDLYSGCVNIHLGDEHAKLISDICREDLGKEIPIDELTSVPGLNLNDLYSNIGCRLIHGDKRALAMYKPQAGKIVHVDNPRPRDKTRREVGKHIYPASDEQAFAFKALMDPDILAMTIVGKAGTGKTLLALLAGYKLLKKGCGDFNPKKILVWRPTITIGEDMGFLPGTLEEKFAPWCRPIISIMRLITDAGTGAIKTGSVETMISKRQLEMEPIIHVQGDTQDDAFIIVDEAQNFTPSQIKMLATRIGNNSKIVLIGDAGQVARETRYLDETSNGLVHITESAKGHERFAHVTLEESERSEMSGFFANVL